METEKIETQTKRTEILDIGYFLDSEIRTYPTENVSYAYGA
jgi:hypothetical protein